MIDTDGELSGWRVLLLMMEHDIHHRSQIDTYAGINGWGPAGHLRTRRGNDRVAPVAAGTEVPDSE